MLPWKLFFRFFSALVLMATGGFAAGHDLPSPFDSNPAPVTATAAPDSTTTTTTTVADDSAQSETGTTQADDSATTTTAPGMVDILPVTDAPTTSTTEPAPAPAPDKPAAPAPKAPLKPAPAPADPAPAQPVDGDAPAVCAAAATNTCAPVAPTADDSRAARVQRCQDWWNSLADAFTAHNRPDWAARASELAGRCDEFVTRWEQWEQTWQDWQARHPKDPKGDHNGDGHADNGQGPKHDHPAPPPAQPKQVSRHGEGRH